MSLLHSSPIIVSIVVDNKIVANVANDNKDVKEKRKKNKEESTNGNAKTRIKSERRKKLRKDIVVA